MSFLRPSRSLIPRCSRPQSQLFTFTHKFHTSPSPNAQARRSPRVKSASQYKQTNTSLRTGNPTHNIEDSLPSIALLRAAQKEGTLDLDPEKALRFLHAFSLSNATKSNGTWLEKLCAEYQMTPLDLCQLSKAILASDTTSSPMQALGRYLMKASCSFGCKEATCSIIYSGMNRKQEISPNSEPFQHLKQLAEDGDKQAMTLMGLILVNQKKFDEAVSWFCGAVEWTIATKGLDVYEAPLQPNQNIDFDGANEALLGIGKLLMGVTNYPALVATAHEAFRVAALELDDPEAYFYLSKLTADQIERENSESIGTLTPDKPPKQYDLVSLYLQKAAASGVEDAWSALFKSSSLQMLREQQEGGGLRALRRPDIAKEWGVLGDEFQDFEQSKGREWPA